MQSVVSRRRLLVLSVAGGISAAVFILSSFAPLNHNDFMYAVAPAVWRQNGALYTEVPFVQAPLSILLNSLLVIVTGNVNIFWQGRMVSMLLVLAAVLLPVLNRSKIRDFDIWMLYVTLCLTNLFIVFGAGELGNYAISLLFLSGAVTAINSSGSVQWRGFATCACAGFAVSAKLYFIVLCPGLLLFFLLSEPPARNLRVLVICALGFLVGLAPILFFLARDFHSFLRWNVQIHELILPTRVPNVAAGIQRIEKFVAIFALLLSIPIGFVIVASIKAWSHGGLGRSRAFGALLLLSSAAAMAVSPIYMFEQYLGPLAFLLILFSAPWNSSINKTRSMYVVLAGVMLCMQIVVATQLIEKNIAADGNLGLLQVLKLQNNARAIVGEGYKCERKLYTTAPLFLLENGVRYPPESAAGPFLMFLRGETVARKGEQFDLEARIKKWNPDIVIWGYYLGSAKPIEETADQAIRDHAINLRFVIASIGQIDGHDITLGYLPGCKDVPN